MDHGEQLTVNESKTNKKEVAEPFPKRHILDSSKLKEFADDNIELDKMAESYPNG